MAGLLDGHSVATLPPMPMLESARQDATPSTPRGSLPQDVPQDIATAFVRDGFAHAVHVSAIAGQPLVVASGDDWARAAAARLREPERSTVVLRRGERVAGRAMTARQPSDWDAFERAWREHAGARAREGATLRLLTGPVTSPTERGLIAALLARHPGARWHVHAPLRDMAAEDGARMAFGRPVVALPHFHEARCVLALAADPFGDGPGARRHELDAAAAGPTLFAVEATPGRFGALAAHRLALAPARIEALLWRVASHWLPDTAANVAVPDDPEVQAFETRLVDALRAAGDSALVIAGTGLSAEAHALVFALNQRLGAIGRTLTLIDPPDAAQGVGTLADLVHALQDGGVDTLVAIGTNPAWDAPAAFGMTLALSRARLLIHAGTRVEETALQADWHLPLAQPFEIWGDALAVDGSAMLLRPLVDAPPQARSASELLALLVGDELRDGFALLRRQWQPMWSRAAGETLWRDSLVRGVVGDSAFAPLAVAAARLPTHLVMQSNPGTPSLTALFVPEDAAAFGDALLLSPATAARLGLTTGDVARAQVDTHAIEAPVRVLSGQADDVVTLPLGGGRRRGGAGVAFNAGSLRPATALRAAIALQATGRRHDFGAGR